MKNTLTLILVTLALALSAPSFAERPSGSGAPGNATTYTVDTSSTNLPATYGAAGNVYASSVSGVSNICVVNGASTKIYLTTSTASNCTGASDKWVVPASGSACYNYTKINSKVCARSSSGTISSGVIDVVLW